MNNTPRGRPTIAEIDLAALRWNFGQVKRLVGPHVKIQAVVKADAYGHGAAPVARALEEEGVDAFGVATVEEGVELRSEGICRPIIILGGVYGYGLQEIVRYHLVPVVGDLRMARFLAEALPHDVDPLAIHLKIDTGMGRIGLLLREVRTVVPAICRLRSLIITGLLSHFARAESADTGEVTAQLERFRQAEDLLAQEGISPQWRHLANSAAVMTRPETYFNMVRPGIMLYGIPPSPLLADRIELRPVMTLKTAVLQLKKVPPGVCVSYGGTFMARRASIIAVLPMGYADGYSRLLSNCGEVLVRGRRAPVVGRICMDHSMIDVTDIPGVEVGDQVVLWGRQGDESIGVDEVAKRAGTIPYEMLTRVGKRVPRVPVP